MYQPAPAVSHGLLNAGPDGGLGVPRAPSALGMQPGNPAPQPGSELFPSLPPSQSPAGSLSSTPRPTSLGPAEQPPASLLGHSGPLMPPPTSTGLGLGGLPGGGSLGAGSLPGSTGFGAGGLPGSTGLAAGGGGGSGWSSLDGIQRSSFPGGAPQGGSGEGPQLARAATFNIPGTQQAFSGSLDVGINRGSSVPPTLGQQPQASREL